MRAAGRAELANIPLHAGRDLLNVRDELPAQAHGIGTAGAPLLGRSGGLRQRRGHHCEGGQSQKGLRERVHAGYSKVTDVRSAHDSGEPHGGNHHRVVSDLRGMSGSNDSAIERASPSLTAA